MGREANRLRQPRHAHALAAQRWSNSLSVRETTSNCCTVFGLWERCCSAGHPLLGDGEEVFGEQSVCQDVDWIGEYEDDRSLCIVDWKRSEKLAGGLVSAWNKRMRAPLQHLDDCDGCKYALQLGCYAYLLERYYGKTVRSLALCCVHPDAPIYTFVPYLRDEVQYLMRTRREVVAARIRIDFEDEVGTLPRCSLTGQPLYDGVRDPATGRLYNKKDALTRFPNNAFPDATDETREVNRRLAEVRTAPSPPPMVGAVPWRDRMPTFGLPAPP